MATVININWKKSSDYSKHQAIPNILYRITLTTEATLETWDDSLEKCSKWKKLTCLETK